MTTKAKTLILIMVAFALTAAQAQTAAPGPGTPPSEWDEFQKSVKNPTDWLSWGGDFRVRNEYYDTIVTLNEHRALSEQDVIRFRARIWADATVVTNLMFHARISAEPREWLKPSFAGAYRNQSGMEWRYGIADKLNMEWKQILNSPLSITAGRQDIMLGDFYDWWLVADGTPGDGSWTFFLDSVRAQYEVKDIKTKFDVIGIYQNPQADEWIPTLDNSNEYPLTDQREQGAILYGSNKSLRNTQIDAYFMYKNDNQETFDIGGRSRTPGDNADIYTVGTKVTGTPIEKLFYSVEGAYQFGWKEDRISGSFTSRELSAYGGKAKVMYSLKDKMNNQFSVVGEYLSGDDPDSAGTDEMFDLLWGRWPRWSELYIYSYLNETGGRIAQINNIYRFGPSWSISPVKKLTFSAMYNALFAPEDTPTRATDPTLFSRDGNFRGHYLQTVLKYQFNKNVSAHLWGEWVWQGDYYAQRDLMTFVRAEVMFTF